MEVDPRFGFEVADEFTKEYKESYGCIQRVPIIGPKTTKTSLQ